MTILSKSFTVIFLLMTLYSGAAFAKTNNRKGDIDNNYAPWKILNEAYNMRMDRVLTKYANSNYGASTLYAQALQNLINENVNQLQKIGRSCMTYHVKTNDDAAALFGCLFAVAAGSKLYINVKTYIYWMESLKKFYNKHEHEINISTMTLNPANIKSIKVPDKRNIVTLPDEAISVDKGWKTIALQDGSVDGFVNNIRVRLAVDTGASSGIYLSSADVNRLGIGKALISTGMSIYVKDNTGGTMINLFYVKHFHVGPIHVHNAYVEVGPGNRSSIGLHLLRRLRDFSIYANKIIRGRGRAIACGPMKWVRMPITQAFSYPFMDIRVNDNRFGLFLDSGMRINVKKGMSDMYVSRRGATILQRGEIHDSRESSDVVMTQNGKTVKFESEIFKKNIGDISLLVMVVPNAMLVPDKFVDGVLMYGFLNKNYVYYDFIKDRMCMGDSH